MRNAPPRLPRGFTLIELLVVITIILLVSVLALTTLPGLVGDYQITEGARLVQAALASARDSAIRSGENRGVRLVYDPTLSDPLAIDPSTASLTHSRLVVNRIVPIEPAPDLSDGALTFAPFILPPAANVGWTWNNGAPPTYPIPKPATISLGGGFSNTYPYFPPGSAQFTTLSGTNPILMVVESLFKGNNTLTGPPIPNPPANWFWNVRIGDKIRFNDSGQYYTVVGPMSVKNPEYYVNNGPPGAPAASTEALAMTYKVFGGTTLTAYPQFLFLVNGDDDNNNGFVDEGFNNLDENFDGGAVADDIGEWYGITPLPSGTYAPEIESWKGTQASQSAQLNAGFPPEVPYTIKRRPVPSPASREILMPSSVVIDLTTWNLPQPERSRLPQPNNGTIDIMLSPSGQVIPTTIYSTPASTSVGVGDAFYHFWIADRNDVYDPVPYNTAGALTYPMLPLPESVGGYNPGTYPPKPTLFGRFLKKDRQLVTLYARTGQVVTNSINNFLMSGSPPGSAPSNAGANIPFFEAQQGIREAK